MISSPSRASSTKPLAPSCGTSTTIGEAHGLAPEREHRLDAVDDVERHDAGHLHAHRA
jgi:hypothetical protein